MYKYQHSRKCKKISGSKDQQRPLHSIHLNSDLSYRLFFYEFNSYFRCLHVEQTNHPTIRATRFWSFEPGVFSIASSVRSPDNGDFRSSTSCAFFFPFLHPIRKDHFLFSRTRFAIPFRLRAVKKPNFRTMHVRSL